MKFVVKGLSQTCSEKASHGIAARIQDFKELQDKKHVHPGIPGRVLRDFHTHSEYFFFTSTLYLFKIQVIMLKDIWFEKTRMKMLFFMFV